MLVRLKKSLSAVPSALILIILLSVLIRVAGIAFVFQTQGVGPIIYGDSEGPRGYIALAENLADGRGFASAVTGVFQPEVFRTPGFPFILAPFVSVVPLKDFAIVMSFVAGIILPLFTYLIGKKIWNEKVGLIAACIAAFEVNCITFSWAVLADMSSVLFALVGLWVAMEAVRKRSWAIGILSGLFLAGAVYIRPGAFDVYLPILIGVFIYLACMKAKKNMIVTACVVAGLLFALLPWYVRNYEVNDTFAFSGAGWRNVYTDYVSSLKSITNGTTFSEEKTTQENSVTQLSIAQGQDVNPAASSKLRTVAIQQIWALKFQTIKLNIALLFAFFTNDNYYYLLLRYGFLPPAPVSHISGTYVILTQGIRGIPTLIGLLEQQDFIPIIGRTISIAIFVLACIGFFMTKSRARYLFASIIILTAVESLAVGFGIEARIRLPIMPLLFLLAAVPVSHLFRSRASTQLQA